MHTQPTVTLPRKALQLKQIKAKLTTEQHPATPRPTPLSISNSNHTLLHKLRPRTASANRNRPRAAQGGLSVPGPRCRTAGRSTGDTDCINTRDPACLKHPLHRAIGIALEASLF